MIRRSALCLLIVAAGCGSPTTFRPTDGGAGGDGKVMPTIDFSLTQVCSPTDPPMCDGNAIATCRSDGTGYDYSPCTGGCANGACTCNPGDVMCMGSNVMKCDQNGMFQIDHTCPMGTQCSNGMCSDARCADETMSTNPHALPTNAWPRFRHDNRNTGTTPTVVADNPKMKWKVFVGGTTYGTNDGMMASGPVVNDKNQIFVGAGEMDNMQGSYYSFDGTGKKLFTFPANRGFGLSTPAVRADAVSYFSTSSSALYAVDPQGNKAWQYDVLSVADADPIITKDGYVIYGSDDSSVYALDFNGKLVWKSDPQTGPGEVDSGLAESCDGTIYAGGRNGWFALDAATGKTLWKVTNICPYGESSPMVTADGTMFGFDSNGTGFAIDKTGKVLWQKQIGPGGGHGGFATTKVGNQVFTVLDDAMLHALDATTGAENWKKSVGVSVSEENAGPIVDGKLRLYYNSPDGNIYCFDTNGNQLWKIPSSGKSVAGQWAGTMAIGNDGTLYVPGNDGYLYAFK
jgi:outer membrane protein assembly factor BamB